MPSAHPAVPTTRIISPTPTPSQQSESRDEYFGPVTRSATREQVLNATPEASAESTDESGEDGSNESDTASSPRRRIRSRNPPRGIAPKSSSARKRRSNPKIPAKGPAPPTTTNGYLSPNTKGVAGSASSSGWRSFSRSPSPLGLIPLHARYRSFIHRHEIPRKLLHVSIGFMTLQFYRSGIQTLQITPWLFTALVPIAATDIVRHRSTTVNKLYVRTLGALMRETEVDGYNGVIWYLLGAYTVLRFFPKDVGVMGVLLLSWCDTAASTFGRLYGPYTIRLRKGKSLAGTLAAWAVGTATAAAFWGWFVPTVGTFPTDPPNAFMFTGRLNLLPDCVRGLIGWTGAANASSTAGVISGPLALGVMSVVSGFVAAGSEFVDLFGWDDNFTIPVLSGLGLWGFLKVFG